MAKDTYKLNEKRIILNMVTSLISTLSTTVISFILVIYIVDAIGNEGNGVFQTATSLYAYLVLAEGGFSAIFKQRAYSAMGKKKYKEVNGILLGFKNLYRKISWAYLALMIIISASYPLVTDSEMVSKVMIFAILMITFSRKAFYILFSAPAQMVMDLYERDYIKKITTLVTTVFSSTLIILVLINMKISVELTILILVSIMTLRYMIQQVIIYRFAKRITWYDLNVKPVEVDLTNLKYQYTSTVSNLIVNSTDTITISIILGFAKASVYGIYTIVLTGVKGIMNPVINVMQTVIGKHIGANKAKLDSFKLVNFLSVNMAGVAFISTVLLINSFLDLTFGSLIEKKYEYALIFSAFLMYSIAVKPLAMMISVTGRFKLNAQISAIEASLNIVLSIILIKVLNDISGAIYATLITSTFKYVSYSIYCSRNIIQDKATKVGIQIFRTWLPTAITSVGMFLMFDRVTTNIDMTEFNIFIVVFIAVPVIASASIFTLTLIFDNKTARSFYRYVPVLKKVFKKT